MTIGVKLSDPRLLGDFGDFLRHATCRVERAGASTLAVEVPGDEADAERHLALFVAAWQGLHPHVEAEWVPVRSASAGGAAC